MPHNIMIAKMGVFFPLWLFVRVCQCVKLVARYDQTSYVSVGLAELTG